MAAELIEQLEGSIAEYEQQQAQFEEVRISSL